MVPPPLLFLSTSRGFCHDPGEGFVLIVPSRAPAAPDSFPLLLTDLAVSQSKQQVLRESKADLWC